MHHPLLCMVVLLMMAGPATGDLNEELGALNTRLLYLKERVLGVSMLQELVDDFTFRKSAVDAESRINDLANNIAAGFKQRFNAVRRIANVTKELYLTNGIHDSDMTIERCCNFSSIVEYDPSYGLPIARTFCYRQSSNSLPNPIIPNSPELLRVFRENEQELPWLKWQYFGTEEGMHTIYPAHKNPETCGDYDPRIRPWYAEAASPIPKDIVIVIDRSQSMAYNNRFQTATNAAKAVIDTLNPNDRVGIVFFSSDIKKPEGQGENCYQIELAFATPFVKSFMKKYLDEMVVKDSTRYIPALEAAFAYFSDSGHRNQSFGIIFMTDGQPDMAESRSSILNRLSQLNAAKGNRVLLLTFGLDYNDTGNLLSDMARMVVHNATAGLVKAGEFRYISSSEDLRYQLGSYYNFFLSTDQLPQPVVTVPYVDFSKLGHIFSICLPVVVPDTLGASQALKGSVCIDMTLADITSEFQYLQRSNFAYVFIIDTSGRTLLHPMLPIPGQDSRSDPLYVQIDYFEPDALDAGILSEMMSQRNGTRTIQASIISNRGNAAFHGVNSERRNTTYVWRAVEGTYFSVCLVVTDCDVDLMIETRETADRFLYHLAPPSCVDHQRCDSDGKYATTDFGTVHLTRSAYWDSDILQQDCDFFKELAKYMTGGTTSGNIHLNGGIKELYMVVSKMVDIWKNKTDADYNTIVHERFIGSQSGIFLSYPGLPMPSNYDHSTTDWYNTAMSSTDVLVFTPPRNTETGRCSAITVAHTILEGTRQAHDASSDLSIGVVGMNLPAQSLEAIMKLLPSCFQQQQNCLLVDIRGFLVYHSEAPAEYYHVAKIEQEIAQDMLVSGIARKESCNDFAWKEQYVTWTISITTHQQRAFYDIFPLSNTNLFLIIKNSSRVILPKTCDCPMVDYNNFNATKECTRTGSTSCTCPCFSFLDYQSCQNEFPAESESSQHPRCSKSVPVYGKPSCSPVALQPTLSMCYPLSCQNFVDDYNCTVRFQCKWCSIHGTCLQQSDECLETNTGPNGNSGGSDSSGVGGIVGGVIGAIVVSVIVIVCVIIFLKCRRSPTPKFLPDQSNTYPNDNPIYDELHYTTPSQVSGYGSQQHGNSGSETRSTKSSNLTSSSRPGTNGASGPVGFVNTGYRRSGGSDPQSVTYNAVLTSQYLTSHDVSPKCVQPEPENARNMDRKLSESSSHRECVSFGRIRTPSPRPSESASKMDYHGSINNNRVNGGGLHKTSSGGVRNNSDLGVGSMLNTSMPDKLAPEPPSLHHKKQSRDQYLDTFVSVDSNNQSGSGNYRDIDYGQNQYPDDRVKHTSQRERYLPMDRQSSLDNQLRDSVFTDFHSGQIPPQGYDVMRMQNVGTRCTVANPHAYPKPTEDKYISDEISSSHDHLDRRRAVPSEQPDIACYPTSNAVERPDVINEYPRQHIIEYSDGYFLNGHMPHLSNETPIKPNANFQRMENSGREHSEDSVPNNEKPIFVRGHFIPHENTEESSSRGSMFSSYI